MADTTPKKLASDFHVLASWRPECPRIKMQFKQTKDVTKITNLGDFGYKTRTATMGRYHAYMIPKEDKDLVLKVKVLPFKPVSIRYACVIDLDIKMCGAFFYTKERTSAEFVPTHLQLYNVYNYISVSNNSYCREQGLSNHDTALHEMVRFPSFTKFSYEDAEVANRLLLQCEDVSSRVGLRAGVMPYAEVVQEKEKEKCRRLLEEVDKELQDGPVLKKRAMDAASFTEAMGMNTDRTKKKKFGEKIRHVRYKEIRSRGELTRKDAETAAAMQREALIKSMEEEKAKEARLEAEALAEEEREAAEKNGFINKEDEMAAIRQVLMATAPVPVSGGRPMCAIREVQCPEATFSVCLLNKGRRETGVVPGCG